MLTARNVANFIYYSEHEAFDMFFPQSWNRTSPISPSMQIDCFWISLGAPASPMFRHAYTALGFAAVMRQKGYFIMTGVL